MFAHRSQLKKLVTKSSPRKIFATALTDHGRTPHNYDLVLSSIKAWTRWPSGYGDSLENCWDFPREFESRSRLNFCRNGLCSRGRCFTQLFGGDYGIPDILFTYACLFEALRRLPGATFLAWLTRLRSGTSRASLGRKPAFSLRNGTAVPS